MVQLKCKTTSLNIIMTFSFMRMFEVSGEVSGDVCRNAAMSRLLNWLSFL